MAIPPLAPENELSDVARTRGNPASGASTVPSESQTQSSTTRTSPTRAGGGTSKRRARGQPPNPADQMAKVPAIRKTGRQVVNFSIVYFTDTLACRNLAHRIWVEYFNSQLSQTLPAKNPLAALGFEEDCVKMWSSIIGGKTLPDVMATQANLAFNSFWGNTSEDKIKVGFFFYKNKFTDRIISFSTRRRKHMRTWPRVPVPSKLQASTPRTFFSRLHAIDVPRRFK